MSTTITYNGSTIAQVNNETKTLLTSGKWLTGNIILTDVSSGTGTLITKNIIANGNYNASTDNADGYSSVSVSVPNGISITEVANTTGTTVIVTGTEASDSSATLTTKTITTNGTYSASSDNADGYSQVVVNVPNSGGSTPSVTQHTIHFVFTDETTTDISLHYTDTFTASAITATTPTTYNNKTVETASLDGVVWYSRPQYEVLFDGSVIFQEQSPYNGIFINALSNLYPVSGEVYRITIDNVIYNCTTSNDGEDYQIGNPKYNYGIDDGSNVPFTLYNGGYGGLNGWTELSASEHTVKIERLTTTQQQGEEE